MRFSLDAITLHIGKGASEMSLAIRIAKERNQSYHAWCPALPGCEVYGRSAEEVRSRIEDAVRGYVARLEVALPRELGRLLSTRRAA
jgi:predicted RNase H-like HicB family nuclease